MSIARGFRPGLAPLLGLAAAAAALAAWALYIERDLVLSHYDAKAHLVVARRVVDSLTPGWKQLGAVWLPLPQLIQILPTQIDLFYETGAFGSLLSIACLAITVWALSQLVLSLTRSAAAAMTTAALIVANPNLLYLHVTPMTEPLLLAAASVCALLVYRWLAGGEAAVPGRLRLALFAAAWVRYEAWAIIGAFGIISGLVLWQRGLRGAAIRRRLGELAQGPVVAVALFLLLGKASTGRWFVSGGFYVPDARYENNPLESSIAVWWGTGQIGGFAVEAVAIAAAVLILRARERLQQLPLALLAAGALPFYAMLQGHPYRVRYMVATAVAAAVLCGLLIARANRPALWAGALVAAALIELPPWHQQAPLLVESQWDAPASRERAAVRTCLARDYRGEKVLASMGSLAHVMQELSRDGLGIADFIHEGNGDLWQTALATGPAPHAGWMLVEEAAEGGDVLAARIRRDAAFTLRMARVCEGGGVALYRRIT